MRLDIALSLEQQNAQGGPEYVQDRIHERAQEFLDLMASDDAIFYFCGLKRMYTSVLDMLEVRWGWGWGQHVGCGVVCVCVWEAGVRLFVNLMSHLFDCRSLWLLVS